MSAMASMDDATGALLALARAQVETQRTKPTPRFDSRLVRQAATPGAP
jgi:hypothetical protein